MFAWIGRQAYRRRWLVVAAWALLILAALPVLPSVEQPLKVGGFSSPDTEAAHAAAALQRDLGFSPSTMLVLFQSDRLRATDAAFQAQVAAALREVRDAPHVTSVVLPSADSSLIAPDNHTAYAIVGIDAPPEEAQRDVPAFEAALQPPPDLTMLVAGGPAFYRDIEQVSQEDLRRAELIAFPVALVALVLVFGSFVAAGVPLVIGGAGVAAVLLSVYWAAHATDLSIFVLNLATMLGLGLAVDYSLFITSRFREELQREPGDVPSAVERTIATAGRAVFFSGTTVLIGLGGLSLFSFMFLRSVGIAGVIVVLWSTLAALTLLPALLGIVGERIDRLAVRKTPTGDERSHGFWATLSHWVMAHPVWVLVPTLTLLALLGLPFRDASISSPDATILPERLPSRQAFDRIVAAYGPGEISPMAIVLESPTSIWTPQN
ncbi:MAG TPA: MMPL family transporter, partial [Thermomicrobiales bacterium]|nr:MMPL family transporter [Thermomicrobiales bacterium]